MASRWCTQNYEVQAVVPRSGPLQFDFVKDWTTRYAACAINSNAVNIAQASSTAYGLPWMLQASQPTGRCRIVGLLAG